MKIKLVACDLDGTLLTANNFISDKTKTNIKLLQNMGIKFCIATGRMFISALPYAKFLELDTPIISYNGALIKDSKSLDVYYSKPLDIVVAKQVLQYGKDNNLYMQKYVEDNLYAEKIINISDIYSKKVGIKIQALGDDFYNVKTAPNKIMFIVEPLKQQAIINEMKSIFAGTAFITSSSKRFIELIDISVNKGAALKFLADYYNIAMAETMAIGDSSNDIDMLDCAGFSVAPENADNIIKDKVDFVSSSNEQDGVALALEKFLL